jgi:hypothetical protein
VRRDKKKRQCSEYLAPACKKKLVGFEVFVEVGSKVNPSKGWETPNDGVDGVSSEWRRGWGGTKDLEMGKGKLLGALYRCFETAGGAERAVLGRPPSRAWTG